MKADWIIPALDIGGTHTSSARIESASSLISAHSVSRFPLDCHADEVTIVGTLAVAASKLSTRPQPLWGISIPGPFDCKAGVGTFMGVRKFESIANIDLRSALRRYRPFADSDIVFINDADAYAIGEWLESGRPERFMCITLGTGVGSGFLIDGIPVTAGNEVPPHGNIHETLLDGVPLETCVSQDAITNTYRVRAGLDRDVHTIFRLARTGDIAAVETLKSAYGALARALAICIDAFRPAVVVIGGSVSQSWDVLMPIINRGLVKHLSGNAPQIRPAGRLDSAPLIGAAWWAAHV